MSVCVFVYMFMNVFLRVNNAALRVNNVDLYIHVKKGGQANKNCDCSGKGHQLYR